MLHRPKACRTRGLSCLVTNTLPTCRRCILAPVGSLLKKVFNGLEKRPELSGSDKFEFVPDICIFNRKMKIQKYNRFIAIVAYCVIILKGQMIGLPFVFWLVFTLFDFGNKNQLFGLLAVLGLILIFRNWNKTMTQKILFIDFVCFILLITPIIGRLATVPLYMFNYSAFIIPTAAFVLCYLISLVYSCKQYLTLQKASV